MRKVLDFQEEMKAEKVRQARLREEYIAAVPEEIRAQVQAAVDQQVAAMRIEIDKGFQGQAAALKAEMQSLKA